jgi:hypothetical protein
MRLVVSVEFATELPPDGPPVQVPVQSCNPKAHFPKEGKLRLVTRASLDQRTLASRQFDALVTQIRLDCGDSISGYSNSGDSLTAVQLAMIESFAGCSVLLDAMTTKVLLGEEVDVFAYCQLSSTLTRIGSRLGLQRKVKTIGPDLGSYLADRSTAPDPAETDDAEAP